MGYLFLAVALLGGLTKGFVGKRVSRDVHSLRDCFLVNLLRLSFCAAISLLILLFSGGGALPLPAHLPFYLFSGVAMAAFCVVYMYGYKTSAYMYLSLFGMLGSVFTGILGAILYDEPLPPMRLLGMVFLVAAVIVMSKYNREITLKKTVRALPLLLLAAASSSLSDISQKVFVHTVGKTAVEYNLYTYLVAALVLLPTFLLAKRGEGGTVAKGFLGWRHILLCLVIAIGLFVNSYAKTRAAIYLSAAEIYPVLQGANLITSAILAHILLKERITARCLLGMTIAFCGLLLMNL